MTTGEREAPKLRAGVAWCALVFVIARIWLSSLGAITVGWLELPDPNQVGVTGEPLGTVPGIENAVSGTDRWDATWFRSLATDGYRDDGPGAAFFPGYPLAIWGIAAFPGLDAASAALLISNAAFLGAMIVLFALTTWEFSAAHARRTVLLLAAFPSSFIFLAPYSESLYLLAVTLTFWFVRRGRWAIGGLAGMLSAFTRSIGVVLVPALLVEWYQRRDRGEGQWPPIATAAVLAGPVAYVGFWAWRGAPLAPFEAQGWWGREFTLPFVTIGRGLTLGIEGLGAPGGWYWTIDAVLALVVLTLVAIGWRLLPATYLTYTLASLSIPLAYPWLDRPLLAIGRFAIVVFPIFWIASHLLRSRISLVMTLIISAVGWSVLAVLFMNWRYVL